jgi:hypothetical protein
MSKYPQDLIVTIEDFKKSDWDKITKEVDGSLYYRYCNAYSKAANIAIKAGEISKGKVLWLLADATSMIFAAGSLNEPFRPQWIIDIKRSAIPGDFTTEDLVFFEAILPEISDFVLKARLSDILWLVKKPKNIQHALSAIDVYKLFPLDAHSFLGDVEEAWERGIRLAKTLGEDVFDKVEEMRNTIYAAFQASNFDQKFYPAKLADLLEVSLISKDKFKDIANNLEGFSQKAKQIKDWSCARAYIERAIEWHRRDGNHAECSRFIVEKAELFVTDAQQRKEGLAAGGLLESAIKAYREIPRKERDQFKVDDRLQELHRMMSDAYKLSLDEMTTVRTPEIEITQYVEASRKYVAGRNFLEALLAFANVYSGPKVDDIEKSAKDHMQDSIMDLLCASIIMTSDGRVASKSSGIDLNDSDSSETKSAVWLTMIRNYGFNVSLVVQAHILPALRVINREHRLSERMLDELCRNSHSIPSGRERIWAKGLFHGFENDFTVSTHLLTPQLEHLVRTVMKRNGFKTTTLDDRGIETECGLSKLLEDPNAAKVFDKNVLFEFKALLTDPAGSNLRNETAHGLLEFEQTRSFNAIYLWWLCLRIVINTIKWKKSKSPDEASLNNS